jgi:hypothetical protein
MGDIRPEDSVVNLVPGRICLGISHVLARPQAGGIVGTTSSSAGVLPRHTGKDSYETVEYESKPRLSIESSKDVHAPSSVAISNNKFSHDITM